MDDFDKYASLHLAHKLIQQITGEPFLTFVSNAPGAVCYSLPQSKHKKVIDMLLSSTWPEVTKNFYTARKVRPTARWFQFAPGQHIMVESEPLTLITLIEQKYVMGEVRDAIKAVERALKGRDVDDLPSNP